MRRGILVVALLVGASLWVQPVLAQEEGDMSRIEEAKSAAPASIAERATIRAWPTRPGDEMPILREGTGEWTCMPDNPATEGFDPMCLNDPAMDWMVAMMRGEEPELNTIGYVYAGQGGAPASNVDPFAEGPAEGNEWMASVPPHVAIILPESTALAGLPIGPEGGGPWVMWRDTPYVHLMVPVDRPEAQM